MGVDGESLDDGGKSSAGLDGGDSIGGGSVMWSWERWMQAWVPLLFYFLSLQRAADGRLYLLLHGITSGAPDNKPVLSHGHYPLPAKPVQQSAQRNHTHERDVSDPDSTGTGLRGRIPPDGSRGTAPGTMGSGTTRLKVGLNVTPLNRS
ncbi:hypothetical protein MUK42_12749 [Musa troglodytarum]|uniref:Uncharacterized protein n=1 Tax=Musa troglodytarum TaxID=320322 RepID=A0A9E7HA83_9LILI|nr:hypothetical protein MUK42_12749 [Musa troglodytarum]